MIFKTGDMVALELGSPPQSLWNAPPTAHATMFDPEFRKTAQMSQSDVGLVLSVHSRDGCIIYLIGSFGAGWIASGFLRQVPTVKQIP